jgi:hypothetical protein
LARNSDIFRVSWRATVRTSRRHAYLEPLATDFHPPK